VKQTTKSKIFLSILILSLICNSISTTLINKNSSSWFLPLNSQTNECVDAWIIIQGDRADHGEWQLLLSSTEFVYDTLLDCGVAEDNIHYLVSEYANTSTSREDGITNHANLMFAFEDWAPTKVGADGVLGVYIASHGGDSNVAIYPYQPYHDYYVNSDLNSFSHNSQCNRMYVIIDTCHAGSFTDVVSADDRIIVASTSPEKSAYFSAIPPHRLQFTEAFFNSLSWGNSIGDAFAHATWVIRDLGYGAKQFPTIDDDHDGVGHTVNSWGVLPNGGDGNDALNTYIAGECSQIIDFYPVFLKVPLKHWYKYNLTVVTVPVSVEIANQTNIGTCFVRAVPTNWFPPDPIDENATGGIDPAEDTYRHYLTYNSIDETYDGTISLWSPLEMDYNLTFVVEDVDGYRGPIVKSQIGLNTDGSPPPDDSSPTVYIKNIYDGDTISEEITIEVIGNDEESGLEELELEINGETVKTEQMPDYLPYPTLKFTLDPNEYKHGEELKITGKAKDRSGGSSYFDVFVTIDDPITWTVWVIAGGTAVVAVGTIIVAIYVRKKK